MGFAEDELAKYMRENMDFHCVKVEELLPFLACLTLTDQEELRAHLQNRGNQNTVWHLLNCLQRRCNWPTQLIKALRRFSYTQLAEELEGVYFKLHQNSTPAPHRAVASPSSLPLPYAALPAPPEAIATPAAVVVPISSSSSSVSHHPHLSDDLQKSTLQRSYFAQAAFRPAIAPQQLPPLPLPMSEYSSSAADDDLSSLSDSGTENSSLHNYDNLDDLKPPIMESQLSANEVLRTSVISKKGKVSEKPPQQHFFIPSAAKTGAEKPVKKNEERPRIFPKQTGAVVDDSLRAQVTTGVSEEEKSMSINKPDVLVSHLDEDEPYSGNSSSLELSLSTAENTPVGEHNSIPEDSTNPNLLDLPEVGQTSPTNITSNQLPNSSVCTIGSDPLMISNSTIERHIANFREPEENHYSYDSSSKPVTSGNRSAIQEKPDTKDSTRYMASGDTLNKNNERRGSNDGINYSNKCRNTDNAGTNYGNKTTSDDISFQPERERTTDPVENNILYSIDTSYHEFHFAENPDINLRMANDTVSMPNFKESVSASSDTQRIENTPGESNDRIPMLSSNLVFTSVLVAFSSVMAVLLWKYLRK